MIRRIAAALLALILAGPAGAETITGKAWVIDGDTLRVGGRKVRLLGLDAPELGQSCRKLDLSKYACGHAAKRALIGKVKGRVVSCDLEGTSYDRRLGTCRAGAEDLGAWMVLRGWAVGDARFPQPYHALQLEAAAARRGLHAGWFEQPCKFRGSCR